MLSAIQLSSYILSGIRLSLFPRRALTPPISTDNVPSCSILSASIVRLYLEIYCLISLIVPKIAGSSTSSLSLITIVLNLRPVILVRYSEHFLYSYILKFLYKIFYLHTRLLLVIIFERYRNIIGFECLLKHRKEILYITDVNSSKRT